VNPAAVEHESKRKKLQSGYFLSYGPTEGKFWISYWLSSSTESDGQSLKPAAPRNYSALKRAYKEHKPPELKENDLEETFVRGKPSCLWPLYD
jgi:hypothetical protein